MSEGDDPIVTTSEERPNGSDWLSALSTLSDLARVRLLRVLAAEELGVGELARALQMPQSTVSRHLKPLREHGWVVKRSAGTASLYRMHAGELGEAERALWDLTVERLRDHPETADDDARLAQVLAARPADARAWFGRIAGEWDEIRSELFGRGFATEALLGLLGHDWTIADLGCGTGDAAEKLAPVVGEVVAIDREPAMLDAARRRLASFENVRFIEAELQSLPLDAGSLDGAVIMLVLHHVDDPASVVRECARTLRTGRSLVIVDMTEHERAAWASALGHRHRGFAESDVRSWAIAGGLEFVRFRRLPPDTATRGPGLFAAVLRCI